MSDFCPTEPRYARRRLEGLDRGPRSDGFCRRYWRSRNHVSRRRLGALDGRFDRWQGWRYRSGMMRRRLGSGLRCRLRCGRWSCRRPRRQERERIDVPLRVRGHTHAEMDVRPVHFRGSARSNRPDLGALAHGVSLFHAERTQMDEGHRVSVAGLDRHDLAVCTDRAREGDDARRRCYDARSRWPGDIDTAMLAARVRVVADDKGSYDITGRRP